MIKILIPFFIALAIGCSPAFAQTYIQGVNLVEVPVNTVTAAGTTTLTATSATIQRLTGSTTQTVVLPVATGMQNGRRFQFQNDSTGTVSIQFHDTTAALTILGGARATFYLASNGTSNGTWSILGANSTDVTVGTFGASPTANGATIAAQVLTFQPGDATHPGLVTTAAQTMAGAKTFSTAPILSSLTASLPLQLDGSNNVTAVAINLSGTQATGTLAAARMPAHTGDVTTTAGTVATSIVATTNSTLATLSGLTTASSLVTVGTIGTGVWAGTTVALNHGGTGLTAGTSGGILGYTATGTLASSALLAANQPVLGGGAGATPTTMVNGTAGQVMQSAGTTLAPTWASLCVWTTWAPVVAASTGTITTVGTVVARWCQLNKTVFISLVVPITTNGTGAGNIQITLPTTANSAAAFPGAETVATGKALAATVTAAGTTMIVKFYDNTYPGSTGASFTIGGHYESQ